MSTIQVQNLTLAYEQRGQGTPPLVFVHGFPFSRQMWAPQVASLAGLGDVLAPDLPGFGESPALTGEFRMDRLADILNAFLDALQAGPVVLCGLSMGGYIALAFYRAHAARLAGLILASTRAAADSPEARQNREKTAAVALAQGAGPIAESMLPRLFAPRTYIEKSNLVAQVQQDMLHSSPAGIAGASLGMKTRPDSTADLSKIKLPCLVIHGTDDQIIPAGEAEGMAHAIPGARFELIPQAGHLANLEQPDRFNWAVQQFYQTIKFR